MDKAGIIIASAFQRTVFSVLTYNRQMLNEVINRLEPGSMHTLQDPKRFTKYWPLSLH